MDTDTNKNVFVDVRYYLINTKCSEIEQLLSQGNAQEEKYLSSFITHVICDDADNSDYSEAKDVFDLTIVKSDWVIKSLFANQILPVEAFSPDPQLLFSKIQVVNVNLPNDVALAIRTLVEFNGGCVVDELTEKTTHAVSIEHDSISKEIEDNVKIVTPDWFTQSIRLNDLIAEETYNPKFLMNNPDNQELIKEIEQTEKEKKEQKENENKESVIDFRENKTIETVKKIDKLELRKSIDNFQFYDPEKQVNLIKLTGSPKPITINEKRDSTTYCDNLDEFKNLSASSIQSQLENTIKLNNRQSTNETMTVQTNLSPPKSRTYKRPRKSSSGISPGTTSVTTIQPQQQQQQQQQKQPSNAFSLDMNDIFETVLSNANKDNETNPETNQENIQNESLKTNTTLPVSFHLLKPLETGSKSLAVPIPSFDDDFTVQNETYAAQENSHLIQFDRCLLGCVFFIKTSEDYYEDDCINDWKCVIEKFGGRVVDNYDFFNNEITHVLAADRFSDIYKKAFKDKKRIVTAYWLEDVLQEQKVRSPWLAYHFPSPFQMKTGPLTNHVISTHGFVGREKLMIKTLIWLLNGKYASCLMNISSYLISKNNEGPKIAKAKKWNIKIVNGIWLMELYLGNTFALSNSQIDERYLNLNVNHVGFDQTVIKEYLDQWKIPIKLPLERIKEAQNNSALKPLNRSPTKRANRSVSNSPEMKVQKLDLTWQGPKTSIPKVMFSGVTELSKYKQYVTNLNGIIADQCSRATHLVFNKIERTAKLLKSISTCENIVHVSWLDDSMAEGRFKDPTNYTIKNEQFESHYSVNLSESLLKARTKKPLCSGLMFYLSPTVRPSYNDLQEMIINAGGTVLQDAPTLKLFTEPFFDENQTGLTSKYVVIGSQQDLCILKPFIMNKIPIYHEELIFCGLLRQKFEPNLSVFLVQD